ncbi:MAG: hypothetical protein WAM85_06680 [Terracidiphilus sp.]
MEETGLCLFLPRRQFSTSIAPSFVEAIGGQRDLTPDPRQIAAAEELLVRLETDGVAVRLNLLGQPGEQPDFVVAAWVLPYVYALRGDRDWRRSPQLTGSRQVSPLAVQTYKLLEAGDQTISQLKQSLGREVSEAAVLRAITELWQQLRIIPVVAAPGQPARWQLLRIRFQKAIAEGASTSQVTAISVLASIYLQAVIAASMEEVELFLAPLTARSKVREVLRGLLATRQVHTISMGHAPHFYVAGTLPEFATESSIYANAYIPASAYFMRNRDHEEEVSAPPAAEPPSLAAPVPTESHLPRRTESSVPRPAVRKPAAPGKPAAGRPHFSRPASLNRDRKPSTAGRLGQAAAGGRTARRGSDARSSAARSQNGARPASGARWSPGAPNSANGKSNGAHAATGSGNGAHANGAAHRPSNGSSAARNGKSAAPSWNKSAAAAKHNGHSNGNGVKSAAKPSGAKRTLSLSRADARPARSSRKPAMTAGAGAGNGKRFGFTARPKGTKKRG